MQLGHMACRKVNQTFTIMPRVSLPSCRRAEGAVCVAVLGELQMFLPALLHQGSESNDLGSQDGQGLWEKTLLHPTPKTVPSLKAARHDIPLFTIPSELWFLDSAKWISPSPSFPYYFLIILILDNCQR